MRYERFCEKKEVRANVEALLFLGATNISAEEDPAHFLGSINDYGVPLRPAWKITADLPDKVGPVSSSLELVVARGGEGSPVA